jgi:hypothetical protein
VSVCSLWCPKIINGFPLILGLSLLTNYFFNENLLSHVFENVNHKYNFMLKTFFLRKKNLKYFWTTFALNLNKDFEHIKVIYPNPRWRLRKYFFNKIKIPKHDVSCYTNVCNCVFIMKPHYHLPHICMKEAWKYADG